MARHRSARCTRAGGFAVAVASRCANRQPKQGFCAGASVRRIIAAAAAAAPAASADNVNRGPPAPSDPLLVSQRAAAPKTGSCISARLQRVAAIQRSCGRKKRACITRLLCKRSEAKHTAAWRVSTAAPPPSLQRAPRGSSGGRRALPPQQARARAVSARAVRAETPRGGRLGLRRNPVDSTRSLPGGRGPRSQNQRHAPVRPPVPPGLVSFH